MPAIAEEASGSPPVSVLPTKPAVRSTGRSARHDFFVIGSSPHRASFDGLSIRVGREWRRAVYP